MADLQIFSNPEFGQVRIIEKAGEPWFVARDVCDALGFKDPNSALRNYCGDGVLNQHPIQDSLGRTQNVRVIQEPDLYRLVFGSKLEGAKKFQDWVFEEVLPSIRKTGGYKMPMPDQLTAVETQLRCANIIADGLRMDECSRISIYEQTLIDAGIPTKNLIPDYTKQRRSRSATELLKMNSAGFSTTKFNKKMEAKGYLEKLSRPSSSGKNKTFWSLTDVAGYFGRNLTSPKNPRETQPHYYEDTFVELLEVLS